MRLLLRADAGPSVGVGHVSRCVAFAEEAVARGWAVGFSGRLAAAGWFASRLRELGVTVYPAVDDASLARLARSVGASAVLVDHYGRWDDLRSAVAQAGALLVSMEDAGFGRRAADVVVDCGLASTERPDDGSARVLLGPRYAPLRSVVRAARVRRAERSSHQSVHAGDAPRAGSAPPDRASWPPEVVVVLGGTDLASLLRAILIALRDTGLPMQVRALTSAELAAGLPGQELPGLELPGLELIVERPRPDLPELLAGADLVVSAAGVTLLELCCIGVPMALVQVSENQAAGYRAAVDGGIAAGLGDAAGLVEDHRGATAVLGELLAAPGTLARLAGAAAELVDGLGARRVLDEVAGRT